MNVNVMKFVNGPFDMEILSAKIDGRIYFIGSSVAKALGYEKPRNAIATHVWDENKIKIHVDKLAIFGGAPEQGGVVIKNINSDYTFINEPGLYQLIFSSKLEKATEFQRWVYNVVLPDIRKHGAFIDVKPGDTPEDLVHKASAGVMSALERLEYENSKLKDELDYEKSLNVNTKTEIDNLNARNDYLETEHDRLTSDNSRLKKIVKFFLDKDKSDFINRNDIKNIPTESNKYKKFLLDVTSRLTRRNPIYKDVRVLDYYDNEEDFYA